MEDMVAVADLQEITSRVLGRNSAEEICSLWLLQTAKEATSVLDVNGIIRGWSLEAERLTLFSPNEVVGCHLASLSSHNDCQSTPSEQALVSALVTGAHVGKTIQRRRDGSRFPAEETIIAVRNEHGIAIGFVRTVRGIFREEDAPDDPRQTIMHLQSAIAHMAQGVCVYDCNERLVLCNEHYSEILGVKAATVKPGATFSEVLHAAFSGSDGGNVTEKVQRIRDGRRAGFDSSKPKEIVIRGNVIAISNRGLPDGGWVSTLDDVTERRGAEKRLVHLAQHDTLTGLPNRATFLERLHAALSFGEMALPFALLCVDLDRFKPINDKLGHATGDAVLQVVGKRITAQLREQDLPARLGGDEFAVLMECREAHEAAALAKQLIAAITLPIEVNGLQVVVGASVGIAHGPKHGLEPDVLLSNADLALYHAKNSGRGCHRIYGPELEQLSQDKRDFERDLRSALRSNGLVLHYQPVVAIDKCVITSFEALLRWECPLRGNVAPAVFIPFAEEVGLMAEIGDWVLQSACREAAKWPDEIKVSVNLSPTQFHLPDLVHRVATALGQAGLPPWRLELEITETAMIDDIVAAKTVLRYLTELGVTIALDDFGTGYSSLSFLRTLPFNRIKIDRSFVQDLGLRPEAVAIVRAVTGLCSSLGVGATAEGAETDKQISMLRAEGCSEIQGFRIAKPFPASELQNWISAFTKNGFSGSPTA